MLGCKNLRDRSVVIFVKYREVSTRMILPNFIGYCRDSVAEGRRKREIEEAYVEEAYVEEAYVRQVLSYFDLILLANQGDSPGQPKRTLRVATAVRYNCYIQGGNMNGSDAPPASTVNKITWSRYVTLDSLISSPLPPCTVGGDQARSDARSEFKILERSPKGRWNCMTVWNIKTAHRRNLVGTVTTIPTVITLSPTLSLINL